VNLSHLEWRGSTRNSPSLCSACGQTRTLLSIFFSLWEWTMGLLSTRIAKEFISSELKEKNSSFYWLLSLECTIICWSLARFRLCEILQPEWGLLSGLNLSFRRPSCAINMAGNGIWLIALVLKRIEILLRAQWAPKFWSKTFTPIFMTHTLGCFLLVLFFFTAFSEKGIVCWKLESLK
jgi:hypothetical protein